MSNVDNPMARFLFAILQQKNLKDIDWNQVASNPILSQEITNGHAARMRYSRFRSAMLGLEPQRRNRTSKEKPNRVTKSKKEPKDQNSKKEEIKAEALKNHAESAASPTESPSIPTRIKQECGPPAYHNSRTISTPMPMVSVAPTQHTIQPRLLTPCSDTDGFPASPAVTASPAAEMLNSQAPYDFPVAHFSHDTPMWSHSPMFPPGSYEHSFTFEPIPMTVANPVMHHHNGCATAPADRQAEGEYVPVKHEHWDNHCT